MLLTVKGVNDIHVATTCNADAAFPFYVFTPTNGSLEFPLACIFEFTSGKLSNIFEFDGVFDETYFDVHNWNPIITYKLLSSLKLLMCTSKVYATAIAAKDNILATALTIVAKDGTHSNFLYFLDYIDSNGALK